MSYADPTNQTSLFRQFTAESHARTSVAFDDEGAQVAANTQIWRRLSQASIPDLERVEDSGGAGVDLIPVGATPDYLYAVEEKAAPSAVYGDNIWRMPIAGGDWARTRELLSVVQGIVGLSDGAILYQTLNGEAGFDVWYSTDGGASGRLVCTTADGRVTAWGMYEGGGVVMLGEYGAADSTRIWRATVAGLAGGVDTFAEAHQFTGDNDEVSRHTHMFAYHAATGSWWCFRGDGENQRSARSDDAGVTWVDVQDRGTYESRQPMGAIDSGDADELLLGADDDLGLRWFNVNAASAAYKRSRGVGNHDRRLQHTYIFDLRMLGGVMYAGSTYTVDTGANVCHLYVSRNGTDWTTLAQFPAGIWQVRPIAVSGGKVHCACYVPGSTTWHYYRLSVPTVQRLPGLLVAGPVTNLVPNANLTSLETNVTDWYVWGDNVLTRVTDESWHGDAAAKLVYGTGGSDGCRHLPSPIDDLAENDVVMARAHVKLPADAARGDVRPRMRFYPNPANIGANDDYYGSNDRWTEVMVGPVVVTHDDATIYVGNQVSFLSPVAGDAFLFDGLQIERLSDGNPVPGRWQVGGTPRTLDAVSLQGAIDDFFAFRLIWQPDYPSYRLANVPAGSRQPVLSLVGGNDEWSASLYIDGGDNGKLHLEVTDGEEEPTTETVSSAAALAWRKHATIHLAIQRGADGKLRFAVANGGAVEYSAWTTNAWATVTDTLEIGGGAGGYAIPGWWVEPRLTTTVAAMSDGELAAFMDEFDDAVVRGGTSTSTSTARRRRI